MENDKSKEQEQSAKKGFKNAFILLILSVIATVCTFIANNFVARFMNKVDYGYGNVNMFFLITLVNFFLKDAMRKTIQKEYVLSPERVEILTKLNGESEDKLKKRSSINLGWIAVIWTVFISTILIIALFFYFSLYYTWNSVAAVSSYVYASCCIVEAISEPLNFKYTVDNDFKTRASSESTGIFIRSVVLILCAYANYGAMSFAYAQIGYVIPSTVMFFFVSYQREKSNPQFKFKDFFPARIKDENNKSFLVFPEQIREAKGFTSLCGLKLLLTEGEKFFTVIAGTLSGDLVAEYHLIANFASLITRFIFSPIEESAFNIFGKSQNPKEDLKFLTQAMRLLISVTLLAISLSYFLSDYIIYLLYSERWVSENTASLMLAYFVFVLFSSINGLSEAYIQGKAKTKEIFGITLMLIINSAVYILSCFLLKRFQALGFIFANIINVLFRISISFYYIYLKHPKDFHKIIKKCSPKALTWVFILPVNGLLFFLKEEYGSRSLGLVIGGNLIAFIWMIMLIKHNYRKITQKKIKPE